ncbi:agmatinase [archaeon]|nr:agmatinase [archaeon]|tara:strand:- start:2075 stop:2971 length:897 start_codon:yes stop_codon:yes gene_type:complete
MKSNLKWMQLPDEYSSFDRSKFVILPISYEKDLTYGIGSAKGAMEIVKASEHLEYYDEEFDCEFFEQGIYLEEEIKLCSESPETMVEKLQEKVASFDSDKFVVSLGGDHSVTIGLVKGLEKIHGDFAVLQIDAHSDFRDSWNGSSLNHACVMRQIVDKHEIVSVGIRSQDKDERKAIDKNDKVQTIYAFKYSFDKVKEALLSLKSEKLYITIDVDGFDPSVISCTGTPEPGGLVWRQVIDLLKLCFEKKKVIGCDVVEFAPEYIETKDKKQQTSRSRAESYILARLISKIVSFEVRSA